MCKQHHPYLLAKRALLSLQGLGNCNVAIYSYRHQATVNSAPAARWFDIEGAFLELNAACLAHGVGGATIVLGTSFLQSGRSSQGLQVDDIQDQYRRPGLGVYIWTSDALFQEVVNQEMSDDFPYGMDPTETNDPLREERDE